MAKVVGPGFSFGLRGSVGLNQYRKVKRDNIVCLNQGGVRSVSVPQAVHRALMGQIAAVYHTLSGVQLSVWRAAATAFNFRWGSFAYFTYVNMPRLRAGFPVRTSPPAPGYALQFNGVNSYVRSLAYFTNNTNVGWSISAWFKSTASAWGIIYAAQSYGYPELIGHNLYLTAAGKLETSFYYYFPRLTTSPLSYNDGMWHFAVLTRTSDGVYRIYCDGALVATSASFYPYLGGYPINDTYPPSTCVGRVYMYGWTFYYPFLGTIDEVCVFSEVLTAAKIAAYYNNGVGIYGMPAAGLVRGWHFDDNAGTTAVDFSASGKNGTLVNSPAWVAGKIS